MRAVMLLVLAGSRGKLGPLAGIALILVLGVRSSLAALCAAWRTNHDLPR